MTWKCNETGITITTTANKAYVSTGYYLQLDDEYNEWWEIIYEDEYDFCEVKLATEMLCSKYNNLDLFYEMPAETRYAILKWVMRDLDKLRAQAKKEMMILKLAGVKETK